MKKEFLSKSGLVIYDEELKQYFEERFGDGISEALSDVNNGDPIYVWIGTKEEYETIEEKLENCLYITTNDSENVEFENTSNKVTTIDSDANNTTYPTTLAVKNYMSNIDGYEKTENKEVVISNASDDNHYPTSKAVYDNVNNTVNSVKEEILTTVEDRVYGVEKSTNKVTVVNADSKHTEYPSARATYEAIVAMAGDSIDKVTTIDENSTDDQLASAKATYDFVKSEMNNINEIIQSQTSTVYSGTSEPDASVGKVGDLWVVTE